MCLNKIDMSLFKQLQEKTKLARENRNSELNDYVHELDDYVHEFETLMNMAEHKLAKHDTFEQDKFLHAK
jgi:hypothetical protein